MNRLIAAYENLSKELDRVIIMKELGQLSREIKEKRKKLEKMGMWRKGKM